MQSGHTKCISEDMKSNSTTVRKYHVVNPNDGALLPDTHKVTVMVTSSYENTYHFVERVESGQFTFTAAKSGDYMACFWVDDHKPSTTLTVDFDWKTGVAAKDWGTVAKKGSIDDEDVVALESYSRQWRMICSSDSVWYVLCHMRWPTLFSNESVLDQLKEQM